MVKINQSWTIMCKTNTNQIMTVMTLIENQPTQMTTQMRILTVREISMMMVTVKVEWGDLTMTQTKIPTTVAISDVSDERAIIQVTRTLTRKRLPAATTKDTNKAHLIRKVYLGLTEWDASRRTGWRRDTRLRRCSRVRCEITCTTETVGTEGSTTMTMPWKTTQWT